jgi:hypothetical protein
MQFGDRIEPRRSRAILAWSARGATMPAMQSHNGTWPASEGAACFMMVVRLRWEVPYGPS